MLHRAAAACVLFAACGAADGVLRESRPFVDEPYPVLEAALGERFVRDEFVTADGVHVPFRLLSPRGDAPEPRPLVVVLHGSGAIGGDNEKQLGPFARAWASPAVADAFPAFVAVPQVAARSADYAPWRDGELASRPGPSLSSLLALVDALRTREGVDGSRVYLVGFSMGGSAALAAATLRPDAFAGLVVFGAIAPPRDLAAAALRTPVWFEHGDADAENPIGSVRAWVKALAAHGASPRFVEYTGMDHRVPAAALLAHDWRAWLFAQRR